ncbi:MAG: hypothetical protein U5K75_10850 [Ahrensia sp.]|nr:hypothetical protein [Ahrensia sp.]
MVLADEAGCNLSNSTQKFEDICAEARGDWLLFMQAGSMLQPGWPQVVLAHASKGGGAASFKLAVSPDMPWWKRVFGPVTHKSPLAKGFLISKRHAQANANGKPNVENMMRGLAIKPLSVGITSA